MSATGLRMRAYSHDRDIPCESSLHTGVDSPTMRSIESLTATEWPKYAYSSFDSRPNNTTKFNTPCKRSTAEVAILFGQRTCRRPQTLICHQDGVWTARRNNSLCTEYLFISWHWASFGYHGVPAEGDKLANVIAAARRATLEAKLDAYWLDAQCIPGDSTPTTNQACSDVYGMSDIVRGAHAVAILLPDGSLQSRRAWVRRLWTLPEGLLAKGKLRIWTCNGPKPAKSEFSRLEMVEGTLDQKTASLAVQVLAAHYDGALSLTRLERTITTIVALSGQESSKYSEADIAYAFMGFWPYKIEPCSTDTLFQAMVRLLALVPEHDSVIERALGSFPQPLNDVSDFFRGLLDADQFGTRLPDIQPRCEVVGVGEDDFTVFLCGCKILMIEAGRAASQCASMSPTRLWSFRKDRSSHSLLLLNAMAIFYVAVGAPSSLPLLAILLVTFVLQIFMELNFARGIRYDSWNRFVIFKGALRLQDLQSPRYSGRQELSYDASSTPFNAENRDKSMRRGLQPPWLEPPHAKRWSSELAAARDIGQEPAWVKDRSWTRLPADLRPVQPAIYPGHQIFTLFDRASGEVSLFQARRQPTVALLCGSEGGRSRTVLCSWNESTRTLTKEAVMRLPHKTWDDARTADWVKVKLS